MKLFILSIVITGIVLVNPTSADQATQEAATVNAATDYSNGLQSLSSTVIGKHKIFAQYLETGSILFNLEKFQSITFNLFASFARNPCLSSTQISSVNALRSQAAALNGQLLSLTTSSGPHAVVDGAQTLNTGLRILFISEKDLSTNIEIQSSFCPDTVAPGTTNSLLAIRNQAADSIGNAVGHYYQICVPSPLYPTVQPVCV